MTTDRMNIRHGFYLSSVRPEDKVALVKHFEEREISEATLNIPFPYSEADADRWIESRLECSRTQPKQLTFAIRKDDGEMIGAVGADSFKLSSSHRAEIGYWLAKPFWGQGIMTEAVAIFVRYAFSELDVVRLTAHVYPFNVSSARVLEKNRFKREGLLRNHFRKGEELRDAYCYGLLKEEV